MTPRSLPARSPRGTTLVELLVALPIALLVATSAALLLLRVARTVRAQSSTLAVSRELRQAGLILAGELSPLSGSDLLDATDTLLTFRSQLGVLLLCDRTTAHAPIVAVPPHSDDAWLAATRVGDRLHGWQAPLSPVDTPRRALRTIVALPSPVGGTGCGPNAASTARRWRLPLDTSAVLLAYGGPLTMHRDVRFRHYRSGSLWWWGRQSRDGATWDAIQPVAGPLRSAADGGVRLHLLDALGTPVGPLPTLAPAGRERIALAHVTFRMPRRTSRALRPVVDSATATIPLRALSYRQRP